MTETVQREYRLLGQPTLEDHLSFVRNKVVDGATIKRSSVVDDWRSANDYYAELEQREANIADEIESFDLDPLLTSICEQAVADPRYRYTFDTFDTSFAMIELDRLVIFQTHVNPDFTKSLQTQLGPDPTPDALLRFCLPSEAPAASVSMQKLGSKRYLFSSESTDFRAHKPTLLQSDQVLNFDTFGPLSAMVGLGVGFGSNFLTAIRVEDRLMLHNGYHRAVALRGLGIKHAPCIIQTVTRPDELEVAAKSIVADDADFYFGTARPPLLKDFFDPSICKEFAVYKTKKMIEVTFDIKDFEVRV